MWLRAWFAAGHLEMHCQTTALKAWIDRPTYGAPPLDTFPTPVPGKCSLLEDAHGDSTSRCCQRSANCSKPDRHPGYCDGGPCEGPRLPASLVSFCLFFCSPAAVSV